MSKQQWRVEPGHEIWVLGRDANGKTYGIEQLDVERVVAAMNREAAESVAAPQTPFDAVAVVERYRAHCEQQSGMMHRGLYPGERMRVADEIIRALRKAREGQQS